MVVVIGGGAVGLAAAFRLAQQGAAVTLLEAGRLGGGTSTSSFAWLNAHNKLPFSYFALNVAGMRAHEALDAELGDCGWRHGGGCLEWAGDTAESHAQRERVERLRGWNYAVARLTRAELRDLEPDIDADAIGDAEVAFYPDEGWMDPALYVGELAHRLVALGGRICVGARVVELRLTGGTVTGVRLAGGETLAADMVVNCTGSATNSVTSERGLHVPMASTLGLLAYTAPTATTLRRVIQAPAGIAIRPDGAGRIVVHDNNLDAALTPQTPARNDLPAVADLMERAARVLPALRGMAAEAVRIATRPIPDDGHPAVGPVPGVAGYYVVVTHSGVTLASLLGGIVADEALHRRTRPEIDEFRPARFFQPLRAAVPAFADVQAEARGRAARHATDTPRVIEAVPRPS